MWARAAWAVSILLFVVFVFDAAEATVLPWPLLELSAKECTTDNCHFIAIFDPTHNKKAQSLGYAASYSFSTILHRFLTDKIYSQRFAWGQSSFWNHHIRRLIFVGMDHWQSRSRLENHAKRACDLCTGATDIHYVKLAFQTTTSSEQLWNSTLSLQMRGSDIAYAKLWSLGRDKFFTRQINAFPYQSSLNVADNCQNHREKCNYGSGNGGQSVRIGDPATDCLKPRQHTDLYWFPWTLVAAIPLGLLIGGVLAFTLRMPKV